jgi:hypothetical protein
MSDQRVPWSYTADYFESCNCQYGCGCNFGGFPDKGKCEAVVAYNIHNGSHGAVDLKDALFVVAFAWPRAIHEGNGTAAVWFDESTTEDQRAALGRILTNQDGGLPYEIFAPTLTKVLGPFVAKIDATWKGTDSSIRIGNNVLAEQETFKNPVTGEPNEVHVVLPTGFIFTDAKATNTRRISADVDGLSFKHENTSGFSAVVNHSNQA